MTTKQAAKWEQVAERLEEEGWVVSSEKVWLAEARRHGTIEPGPSGPTRRSWPQSRPARWCSPSPSGSRCGLYVPKVRSGLHPCL